MLQLLLSPYWQRNRNYCLEMLKKNVQKGQGHHILLVPEQFSHDYERRLCAVFGDTISRYAEVLSFSRLANRVFSINGGIAVPTLDGGGRLLAMAAAVQQLRPQLKSYAAAGAKPEFLSALITAVDEFKSCRVTPDMLKAASAAASGLLAQKTEELALLLEGYNAICAGFGQDPRDKMTKLLEQLELGDFAANHYFYIDGFSDFTAQEQEIIRYLMEVSPSVLLCLTAEEVRSDTPGMELAGETAASMLSYAAKRNIPYKVFSPPQARSFDPLTQMSQGLLSGAASYVPGLHCHAAAHRFSGLRQECTFVAARIRELIQNGCRYRDISVVLTDPESYIPVLRQIFARYQIPTYIAGTEDILHKSVIYTILTALDAVTGMQEQRDVLRYLKSVLSPLTPEECDRLENYAIAWGIRGSGWEQPFTKHPGGLGKDWTEADKEILADLNCLRERGFGPLSRLKNALNKGETVGQQLRGIYTFLEEVELAHRLESLAADYEMRMDSRGAQELEQLWDILIGAMEQMDALLGDFSLEPEVLSKLFKLLLSQYSVGTIPQTLDSVTVGNVGDMRRHEAAHVFLLGAHEGYLPKGSSGGMVLTESERANLMGLGIPLQADLYRQLEQELGSIFAVTQTPGEAFTMTMGSGQCAPAYRRLCLMLGKDPEQLTELSPKDLMGDSWESAVLYLQEKTALPQFLEQEGSYLSKKARFDPGTLSPQTVQALYGKELRLSASQVDKAASCRFAYFMRYGLGLKERKEITIDPAEFGTFVHDVLERTARKVKELGGFQKVSLEDTEALAMEYAKEYHESHFRDLDDRSSRQGYLFRRNLLELKAVVQELWRELSRSEFLPEGFEVNFSPFGDMPPVNIPGGAMPAYLRGFVDRLDIYQKDGKTYVRVVDYKTGKKDFDYCDVLCGIGLQMLIYLFALEDGGEALLGVTPETAGVLYFPARCPVENMDAPTEDEAVEKQRKKTLRRSGLILAEGEILSAMDPTEDLELLPVKVKKSGEITGDLASPAQFRQLKTYLMDTLRKLVDQIAGGEIAPNPYFRGDHDACRFCEFAPACHLDLWGEARVYQKVDGPEFWAQIEKEAAKSGN